MFSFLFRARMRHVVGLFVFGFLLSFGIVSAFFFAKSAGLSATNVEPASLDAGAVGNVTVSFTTVTTLPAAGKIKVTFPGGFNVSLVSGVSCPTMDGTFGFTTQGQAVIITRQGNGTDQPGAAESCTINTVTNPSVAGTPGTYAIATFDGGDVSLDADMAVATDTILPAFLTSANVEPASLVTNTMGTVTLTFTTSNMLETDGKIKVTFPGGFNVSGANGGACPSMDGSFVTSVSGQEVTLTRVGGTPEPAGAQTCTVNNIANPASPGVTGTYALQTTTNSNAVHDVAMNISGDTLVAPSATLTSTNVQPASLEAGSSGTVTLSFTSTTNIPADGKIKVFFPSGFIVSGASGGTCSTMDGTFVTTINGLVVTLTRQNNGTIESPAPETCTINAIVNPNVVGATGTYTLQTTTSSNVLINQDAAVPGDTFIAGVLTSTDVQPASLVVNTFNTVLVTFTTKNALESNGKIKVTFPAGFDVSGAATGTCSSMDGSFATSINGQDVIITRSGGTSEPAGAQTCTIQNVRNPNAAGAPGNYAIQTLTNAGNIHDAANVSGDTFTSAEIFALQSTNVQPASLLAGATSVATVSFTNITPVPADGKIRVTFPSLFDLSGVSGVTCPSFDGGVVFGVNGQAVTITRTAIGSIDTPGPKTCTMTGVKNPVFAGDAGVYGIETLNAADVVLDQDLAVAQDTITPALLTGVNVEPASLSTGATGAVTISFTLANTLEANGKIKVTFPEGFNVSGANGAACSSMDGSFATSVSGQEITITRSGGSSEAPGAQVCTLQGIRNPAVAGAGGSYGMLTTANDGRVHDAQALISSDTIVASALVSPGVTFATRATHTSTFVTVRFTTVNNLDVNDKIKVTFPSGFNVAGATSGTCSGMDGSFSTATEGQAVIITRSGLSSVPAGAYTCTVAGIVTPRTAGVSLGMTVATTNAAQAVRDSALGVPGSLFVAPGAPSVATVPVYTLSVVDAPQGVYWPGDFLPISWTTEGSSSLPPFITISFSQDNGVSWQTIVQNTDNDGGYGWIIPEMQSSQVRLKIEATDLVTLLATATSDTFTVGSSGAGGGANDSPGTSSGNDGHVSSLLPVFDESGNLVGSFVRTLSSPTVYYVNASDVRFPFPDTQTFFTYQDSFDVVSIISEAQMASYTMGDPLLPRAGTVLVKREHESSVYAIENDHGVPTLRWIASESVASALYGPGWKGYIIDLMGYVWDMVARGHAVTDASLLPGGGDRMYTHDELQR